MMIHHDEALPLLDELLDERLEPELRERVQMHVEECAECADEVDFMLTLRQRARALPREIAPDRDLWAGIEARLRPRSETSVPDVAAPAVIPISAARRKQPPRWQRWGALAAAAAVIMAVSSAVTVQLMRDPVAPPVAVSTEPVPGAEGRPLTSLAAFEPTEREYQETIADLEAEFRSRRGSLSPETVAVVEENLRIIDTAIGEIRDALAADPTSVDLPLLLSGVYRSRVELLESTLRLNSAT
jgi:anti-sigma factor RsiW